MNSRSKNTKLFLILLFSVLITIASCKSGEKVSKEVRDAEKAEMQAQKEADKEYQQAKKRHYKMQSKQSKQIMKEMKAQGKTKNKSKKRSLWNRTFNNDCK